jgi:hypothetical protein
LNVNSTKLPAAPPAKKWVQRTLVGAIGEVHREVFGIIGDFKGIAMHPAAKRVAVWAIEVIFMG